jgi:cobalt/nickel transport system permease protein
MFVFNEPGNDLLRVEIGGVSLGVTDGGVLLLLKLVLRALAVVTLSLAVVMTTKYQQIAYLAHRTMPGPLATVFLLSYRFLFVTTDEVTDILDAMHARNGNMLKGFSTQTRLFAGIFGLGFVHAFERAERISKAMESRGFTGELPAAESVGRPSAAGYALVVATLTIVAVAAYSRYFEEIMFGW